MKAIYDLYVTDMMGTTTPTKEELARRKEYIRQPSVLKAIEERTGCTNIVEVMEKGAKAGHEGRKDDPAFRKMIEIDNVGVLLGYARKELKMALFPDVGATFQALNKADARLRVFSSGARGGLKAGYDSVDLDRFVEEYHSPDEAKTPSKFKPISYQNIAKDAKVDISRMCFITDDKNEANTAVEAGVGGVFYLHTTEKQNPQIKELKPDVTVLQQYSQLAQLTIE